MASANGILPTIQQNLQVQITSPVGALALLGTSSAQVIGANPARRGIVFINPTTTRTYTLVPANQTAVAGQGVVVLPQAQVSFIGDGKLINYNCGWNGIADGGSNNPLEILELL